MQAARFLVGALVPLALATAGYLQAAGLGALVDATLGASVPLASLPPAHVVAKAEKERSAASILARNAFDHETGPYVAEAAQDVEVSSEILPCPNVRATMFVASASPELSLAAFEVGGKKLLRRKGGEVDAMRVAYIAGDRAWLDRDGALCLVSLHAPPPPPPPPPPPVANDALARKIVKRGAGEYEVDRSAVEMLMDPSNGFRKARVMPEKEGVRVSGIKPGSPLTLLGVENGDRIDALNGFATTDAEQILMLYGRLRTGAFDHLTMKIQRAGKPMEIDYAIR